MPTGQTYKYLLQQGVQVLSPSYSIDQRHIFGLEAAEEHHVRVRLHILVQVFPELPRMRAEIHPCRCSSSFRPS